MTFQDVVVDFTSEEWHLLDYDQKILYWDVMLENLRTLILVECPDAIFKVEQGQELRMVGRANLHWSHTDGESKQVETALS